MIYSIACIAEKTGTNKYLRALGILAKVLKYYTLKKDTICFLHTDTEEENTIYSLLRLKKYTDDVVITQKTSDRVYKELVRRIHPRPYNITKKTFHDLYNIAIAVTGSQMLIIATEKQRGRAMFARKVATSYLIPSLNICSEEEMSSVYKLHSKIKNNQPRFYSEFKPLMFKLGNI